MSELLVRMCEAAETAGAPPYQGHAKWMTAALRVAADALLSDEGRLRNDDVAAGLKGLERRRGNQDCDRVAAIIVAVDMARRARMEAPAKTAEERVRIELRNASDGSWEVWEDENYCGNHSERNAKALRLGLIATLKEEGKQA